MSIGGKREGAGRKAGIPNERTSLIEKRVASTGITPLDYLLNIMRDETVEPSRRDEMAKAAAPYVHSKMPTAIITPSRPDAAVGPDDEDLLKTYLSGIHAEADES